MDFTFNIALPDGDFYYDFFYQLSFLVGFLMFIYLGWRRKYPMATWLLLSVITSIFLILGSKIGTYTIADWNQFFTTGSLPPTAEKTMIGALLFGWIGVGVAQRLLRFRASVLDVYVWIIPVGMIVQRLGCLFVGCCFGKPTWSNWGVCYSPDHHIFDYHFQEGWVGTAANYTPAVHPVPLYLILGFVVVMFILKKFQNRFRANGSHALFGLMLIFGVRFIVEFFRDPITNHGQGEILLGLKIIQWILLGVIAFFSIVLFFREKIRPPQLIEIPNSEQSFTRNLWVSLLIVLVISLGKNWLTLPELQSIFVRVLLSYIALAFVFYKYFFKKKSVQWAITVCILSVFLMGQTYTEQSKAEEFKPSINHRISMGGSTGPSDINYIDREYSGGGSGGCGGGGTLIKADTISIGPNYTSFGINYSMRRFYKKNKSVLLNLSLVKGNYPKEVTDFNNNFRSELVQLTGLGFYLGHEGKIIGFGLGGIFGNWGTLDRGREHRFGAQVATSFRLGLVDKFYIKVDGNYDEAHPYSTIASSIKFGIGIGHKLFNWKNKSRFRIGLTNILGSKAYYFESDIFLTEHIFIGSNIRWGEHPLYGFGVGYEFK